MGEIKRIGWHGVHGMQDDANGDYVLHSDHEAEVARLRAEVEKYRTDADLLKEATKKIASGELDGYRSWLAARDALQRVNGGNNAAMGASA